PGALGCAPVGPDQIADSAERLHETDAMNLRARDVAKLLDVSEQTVYRWVRDRSLPAHRIGEQYRFSRVELQEWAATHGHRVSPELFAPQAPADAASSLVAALERGGVHAGVPGA